MLAEGLFKCLNKLCSKVYRHKAVPYHSDYNEDGTYATEGKGYLVGHLLSHHCPFCGSSYVEWLDYKK